MERNVPARPAVFSPISYPMSETQETRNLISMQARWAVGQTYKSWIVRIYFLEFSINIASVTAEP